MTNEVDEVRITLKQVWEMQQTQFHTMNDMSSKIDRLLDSHDRVGEQVKDHETRIRLLEKNVWALPSAATVISLAGIAYQIIKG